jgi:hypothetical protein
MRPTLELLGELAEQTRSLVQVELSLLRAELRERGASISASLTKVGVGLRGLKPARLAPSKSISQISSLLGEFQDGADVRGV